MPKAAAPMMPFDDAIATMLAQVSASESSETVPLTQALDRIAAEDIVSPIDVPGHDNSAMDGYAVKAGSAKTDDELKVIGVAAAGHPFAKELADGECVRIMTGATIPTGADAIVIQENVTANTEAETITINQAATVGDNIRLQGADIKLGHAVIATGERLSPVDIGLLASLGVAEVNVKRKLTVAIFSTGDELVAPGAPLEPGQIYDSNRYLIHAMLQRFNADIIDLGRLPDDLGKIKDALNEAVSQADAIITSGGVSVGDADHTKAALDALGDVGFWKVAMKPGKPFAFGRIGAKQAENGAWFFGLPGNPVAAAVTMDQLVQPVLIQLAGQQPTASPVFNAAADEAFKKRPGRADFQRATYWQDPQGQLKVKSAGSQSSGVLSTMKSANSFARLEQQRDGVAAGETVEVLPFSALLR